MIKNEVYEKAFQRAVVKRTFFGGSIVPLVNIGVRHISGFEFEGEFIREDVEKVVEEISIIILNMSSLTPKEFMNQFPITKEYHGAKYGAKDYFFSIKMMQALIQDKPLGHDILNLLYKYSNPHITEFAVKLKTNIYRLKRFDGEEGMIGKWPEKTIYVP